MILFFSNFGPAPFSPRVDLLAADINISQDAGLETKIGRHKQDELCQPLVDFKLPDALRSAP